MKLLGAVLIVKDEEKSIRRTIDSLTEHCDVVTVADTGSTDGTDDIVRSYDRTKVALASAPFTTYADTRNAALELAASMQPTAFTLTLSADETLQGGAELRAYLERHLTAKHPAYFIMMRVGPLQFPFPRIFRTGAGCRYVNSAAHLHEKPVDVEGLELTTETSPLIPGVFVVHQESDPARKHQRMRDRDLPALTAAVNDESKAVTDRMEAMFQLAETHFILGYNEKNSPDGYEVGGRWLSHMFEALGLYWRYAEVAEYVAKKMSDAKDPNAKFVNQRAMQARWLFCYVGETFGLYEPVELNKRLAIIAGLAPELPEVHWSIAKNTQKVSPAKAIPLAMKSAKVARHVYENPVHGPVDTTLEWKSYLLAADCARQIKDKRLQASFAQMAIKAGAPLEIVGDLLPMGTPQ